MRSVFIALLTILEYFAFKENFQTEGKCSVPKPPLFGAVKNYTQRGELVLEYTCDKNFVLIPRRSRKRYCEKKTVKGGTYFDWSEDMPTCNAKGLAERHSNCPKIKDPQNGLVEVTHYKKGGNANFYCKKGHVLVGSETLECLSSRQTGGRWSKSIPTCEARDTVEDFARAFEDKFISKNVLVTAEGGVQGKLSVGKAGLDLVFAMDTSESIGLASLNKSKEFIKVIMKRFQISNRTDGGINGTRMALFTFNEVTTIVFNLDDPNVRSLDQAFEKLDQITNLGGGTDFYQLLSDIQMNVFTRFFGKISLRRNPEMRRRAENANRAVFIITDAEESVKNKSPSKRIAQVMRTDFGFEMFAIGVGTGIKKSFLADIASPPYHEHVFEIKNFTDLKAIGDIISEDNIDYGQCGISGNTEVKSGTESKVGAWPWLGWMSVFLRSGKILSCGGVLLCDRYFMTLASCVTEMTEEGLSTLTDRINVYLGDHDNQKADVSELMVTVTEIHVHPNYTGERNQYDVRPFDIAILELGEDNTTRPNLNKYIRPICFLEQRMNHLYTQGETLLSTMKIENEALKGVTAGWGHMGEQVRLSNELFPWKLLKQNERQVQDEKICRQRFQELDQEMFFCVGNVYNIELESCVGDVGGPLMGKLDIKRYGVLGLALRTHGCSKNRYDFSIFLNVLYEPINKWVEKQLRGCNRVTDPVPYIEEEENEEVQGNVTAEDSNAGNDTMTDGDKLNNRNDTEVDSDEQDVDKIRDDDDDDDDDEDDGDDEDNGDGGKVIQIGQGDSAGQSENGGNEALKAEKNDLDGDDRKKRQDKKV